MTHLFGWCTDGHCADPPGSPPRAGRCPGTVGDAVCEHDCHSAQPVAAAPAAADDGEYVDDAGNLRGRAS